MKVFDWYMLLRAGEGDGEGMLQMPSLTVDNVRLGVPIFQTYQQALDYQSKGSDGGEGFKVIPVKVLFNADHLFPRKAKTEETEETEDIEEPKGKPSLWDRFFGRGGK